MLLILYKSRFVTIYEATEGYKLSLHYLPVHHIFDSDETHLNWIMNMLYILSPFLMYTVTLSCNYLISPVINLPHRLSQHLLYTSKVDCEHEEKKIDKYIWGRYTAMSIKMEGRKERTVNEYEMQI